MPRMKDKIKNLFGFIGRAWNGGLYGKVGVLLLIFAVFMFIRLFCGQVNVSKFVVSIWHLNSEKVELANEQKKLDTIRLHIKLLEKYSPDYVQELGLRYLNIGDPKFKVLKI